MDFTIRGFIMLAIANQAKEFEIIKIRVEEGVDLGFGIKDSLLPNVLL